MKQKRGAGRSGGHEECETECISAGDMEEKGMWVPRMWEQGGTYVESAMQIATQNNLGRVIIEF